MINFRNRILRHEGGEAMKRLSTVLALVLIPIWGGEAAAQASGVSIDVQNISPKRIESDNVYSVKFVCGLQSTPNIGPVPSSFVPARYRTAINIHNLQSQMVRFTVTGLRTQSSFPASTGPLLGAPVPESLAANQGLELSCEDIMAFIHERNVDVFVNFLFTGFVIIRIPQQNQLDAVGVYTVTVSGGGGT
jgi:hypothetical protein